ncbi:Phospholipid scramblase 2 [Portunus trituberculatus]|uniref:Phospholipid scramblase n=1 Tax=Portunus trituberculatus TaxID=210409 RepID=A0A5B7HC56_PORTR|nr:Phospholipid scramblase 2 [Portunus trituberculatus]
MNNKYVLKNSMGQEFLTAREDTDCCTRQCCGPIRPFEMGFFDSQEREVMRLSRPLACGAWCCPCSMMVSGATLSRIFLCCNIKTSSYIHIS